MKVLVACEFSGRVRDAFLARGHNAISCDILPSDSPGPHYQGDVLDILSDGWDLMIAHPPCTHLAVTGARHFPAKIADGRQGAALDFVRTLMQAPIEKICIENPVSVISTYIRKPDQIIQPYWFGDQAAKKTCLWLKNLPKLVPTNIVEHRTITTAKGNRFDEWYFKTYVLPPKERTKARDKTFQGIADAMAEQWGTDRLPTSSK